MRLTLHDLSIGYPGKPLVKHINLVLQSGAPHYLIGANGVGKSTLMLTLSGALAPLSGTFSMNAQAGVVKLVQEKTLYLQSRELVSARITLEEYLLIASSNLWVKDS